MKKKKKKLMIINNQLQIQMPTKNHLFLIIIPHQIIILKILEYSITLKILITCLIMIKNKLRFLIQIINKKVYFQIQIIHNLKHNLIKIAYSIAKKIKQIYFRIKTVLKIINKINKHLLLNQINQ